MNISALIPAHNDAEVLRECLDSVITQTVSVDQIVVVADTCTDNTAEVAAEYGAYVVEVNEGGKSGAQNAGLPFVTGDILICIDADTVIAKDVVARFVEELEQVDATCANMLPIPEQKGFWVANRRFAYALGRYWWRWTQAQVGRLMVLSGCAYAVHTDIVRSIGGFPGGLITCDMDFTWNLYSRGYKTTFCHNALAYTYDPETFTVYKQQMRRWASGFFQNIAAHKKEMVKSPSAILVVGSMLFDLFSLPVFYAMAIRWGWHHPSHFQWLGYSILGHFVICSIITSRTISWRQSFTGFFCYFIANWINKAIYLWTFVREWILGKHYESWTGRQGRKTQVSAMTTRRKISLAVILSTFIVALPCLGYLR